MRTKYRSRNEIVSDLLRSAGSGGATKTRLMYGAFLSFRQVKEYLGYVVERGLLTYDEGDQMYSLTKKGLEFLSASDQVEALVGLEPAGRVEKSSRKTRNTVGHSRTRNP